MKAVGDDERLSIIQTLHEAYCQHCGCDQSNYTRPCQCWNDE